MNIPNALTLFRILLVPLLVILLLEGQDQAAFFCFLAAGVSDGLDGFLARVLKQKTRLGAFLDPIADKLLLTTSFVTLAVLGNMPSWLAVLVVSRDVIIVGGIGVLLLNDRPLEIHPTMLGKTTTFLQLLALAFVLGRASLADLLFFEKHLFALTAVFTTLSGFSYLNIGFRILGRGEREEIS